MWYMHVVLTETENENDSDVAKMTQERALATLLADGITSTNNPLIYILKLYLNKKTSLNLQYIFVIFLTF